MRQLGWLLAAVVGCLPLGCMTTTMVGRTVHPVEPPRPEVLAVSRDVPAPARERVHVYLVNGADPGHYCNFVGQADYMKALGYRNVYFGQMWDTRRFEDEIRQVRRQDPNARVVLIGYSAGVYLARDICYTLNRDGLSVDLLIYLGGDLLKNEPSDRPPNAREVINVRSKGLVFLDGGAVDGADLTGCQNMHLGPVAHSSMPSDKRVLEMLARSLAAQAAAVSSPP